MVTRSRSQQISNTVMNSKKNKKLANQGIKLPKHQTSES
jgi:hypothetical protein